MSSGNTEERRKLELPDRRKQTYASLEKRIDDHADHIEKMLQRWIRRGLVAMSVIALACTLALVGYGVAIHSIQNQRHDFCADQNDRHDKTIALFRKLAADTSKKHPEQASQIKENTQANIALISALAPKRNCDAFAPEGGFFP